MGLETVTVEVDLNLTGDEMPLNGPLLAKCLAVGVALYLKLEHGDEPAIVEAEAVRIDGTDYLPDAKELHEFMNVHSGESAKALPSASVAVMREHVAILRHIGAAPEVIAMAERILADTPTGGSPHEAHPSLSRETEAGTGQAEAAICDRSARGGAGTPGVGQTAPVASSAPVTAETTYTAEAFEREARYYEGFGDSRSTAPMLRAAASLTRQQQEVWKCKARAATDPPQDCAWPTCGCDPHAQKVVDALHEGGALRSVRDVSNPEQEIATLREQLASENERVGNELDAWLESQYPDFDRDTSGEDSADCVDHEKVLFRRLFEQLATCGAQIVELHQLREEEQIAWMTDLDAAGAPADDSPIVRLRVLISQRDESIAQFAERDAQIVTLTARIYVPHQWQCSVCGFVVSKMLLRASDGAVGIDTSEVQDICPNDGTSLQRVTWEDAAEDHGNMAQQQLDRALKAEAQRDTAIAHTIDQVLAIVDVCGNLAPIPYLRRQIAALRPQTGDPV